MVKYTVLAIFLLALLGVALMSEYQMVRIFYFPFRDPAEMPLSMAVMLFALYGVAGTVLLSLIDRAVLKRENKKLRKQNSLIAKELEDLRQLMADERGPR